MFTRTLVLFILHLWQPVWAASVPLFSQSDLNELKELKSDKMTIAAQIEDWRQREAGFFKNVIKTTAAQDLASMRKDLPYVMDRMEKADEAAWLKKTLRQLSLPSLKN